MTEFRRVLKRRQVAQLQAASSTILLSNPAGSLSYAIEAYIAAQTMGDPPLLESVQQSVESARDQILNHRDRYSQVSYLGEFQPFSHILKYREGQLFSRYSADRRLILNITQRGEHGADPPGVVTLNDLHAGTSMHLQPCDEGRDSYRVEDATFSTDDRFAFVVWAVHIDQYSVPSGECVGSYNMSQHAESSPVHLVRGGIGNGYVLSGVGTGGLWLVDPKGELDTQVLQREWARDAAIVAEPARDGQSALVVFESGRLSIVAAAGQGPNDTAARYQLNDLEWGNFLCIVPSQPA